MKRGICLLVVLLFLLSLPVTALGQLDLSDQFVLLATTKTKTMQKELDEAAGAGYRLVLGARTSGSEIMVVMERQPEADYQYLLLATTRSEKLQEEISDAAAEGYRLVPSTVMSKDRPFGGPEIVLVMERTPEAVQSFEYKILGTSKTSTMQKEILEAIEEGYELVAMASPSEQMAVMERAVSGGM